MDSAAIAASSPSSHFTKLRNPNPSPTSRLNFTLFKSFNRGSFHSYRSPSSSSPSFPCRIATTPPSSPFQTNNHAKTNLDHIISEFQSLSSPLDRLNRLLRYSTLLPPLDDAARTDSNRVMGCTARVWLEVTMDSDGKMRFRADSDSEITRGFCYCLIRVVEGMGPEEVLDLRTEDLGELSGVVGGLAHGGSNSRVNTWGNVLIGMQKRTKGLVAQREGKVPGEAFPSLVVTAEGIEAKGSYAEAQVRDS